MLLCEPKIRNKYLVSCILFRHVDTLLKPMYQFKQCGKRAHPEIPFTAAGDISIIIYLYLLIIYFSEKIMLDTKQTMHMNSQFLFSLKNPRKNHSVKNIFR